MVISTRLYSTRRARMHDAGAAPARFMYKVSACIRDVDSYNTLNYLVDTFIILMLFAV